VDGKRSGWLKCLAEECEALLSEGVPLRGVCLYPILGMPEWHAQEQWTCMGLWDLAFEDGSLRRQICQQMHDALRLAQELEFHPGWRQDLPGDSGQARREFAPTEPVYALDSRAETSASNGPQP
jgi:hypothetical protein